MSAKSLLATNNDQGSRPPRALADRTEVPIVIRKHGRIYRVVLRDRITVEDPYLAMVRAAIFSIRTGEPYMGRPPERSVRDFMIKSSVVI